MKYFLLLTLAALVFVSGCQPPQQNMNSQTNANANANKPAAKADVLKVNDVIKAFQAANMPLNQLEYFNAGSDPDKLLGKPNQYIEKVIWQTKAGMGHNVEVFANDADLQARKKLVETDKKTAGDFLITHKNVLLRIHKEMVPVTVARFEQTLKAL